MFDLLKWKKKMTVREITERTNKIEFMGIEVTEANIRTVLKHFGSKHKFVRAMRKQQKNWNGSAHA
ncbi:MAG: hypothetical protein AAB734_04705 [Patescibacteria group bacterium]